MKEKTNKDRELQVLLLDDVIFSQEMGAEQLGVFTSVMERKQDISDYVGITLSVLLRECGYVYKGGRDKCRSWNKIVKAINMLIERGYFLGVCSLDYNDIDLSNINLDTMFNIEIDRDKCTIYSKDKHGTYLKKESLIRVRDTWLNQSTAEHDKAPLRKVFLTYSYFISKIHQPYGEDLDLAYTRTSAEHISRMLNVSVQKQRDYIKWLVDNGLLHSKELKTCKRRDGTYFQPGTIFAIDFPNWKQAIDRGIIGWRTGLVQNSKLYILK